MESTMTVDEVLDRARKLGADAGKAAGSWVLDGNTSISTACCCIKLDDDGDPQWWDKFGCPRWLSGEDADSPTPLSLLTDLGVPMDTDDYDEILGEYEDAAANAYIEEVLRVARVICGE